MDKKDSSNAPYLELQNGMNPRPMKPMHYSSLNPNKPGPNNAKAMHASAEAIMKETLGR